jgi:hypothetical protein
MLQAILTFSIAIEGQAAFIIKIAEDNQRKRPI